jgi:superfamily II DNA or RNA helicase
MTTDLVIAASSDARFPLAQGTADAEGDGREESPSPSSPFAVDLDRLRTLVTDRVIKRGIAYFKENRVTELDWDAAHVWARVEGSRPESPYFVEIGVDGDGELTVDCDCPFDWEPFCKHAVASLLAWESRQPITEARLESAADEAIAARVRRGRREVVVEPLEGTRALGTWRARSLTHDRPSARAYRVELRSLDERVNHCTCPDFAGNRLGTCKHVEAVLHRVRREANPGGEAKAGREAKAGLAALGAGAPTFVVLAWDVPEAPQIRVRLAPDASGELRTLLQRHFDSAGCLRGALPEALHRLQDDLCDRRDVQVGDDVVAHVQRLGEDAAHHTRRQAIRAAILGAGNQLPGVRARLYPYQVEGVAFLASNGRALLADDMGLGKTLQAIAAATWLFRNAGVRRVLVVCPASLKHQWAREVTRFTGLDATVVGGPPATRLVQYRSGAPFTIANYELVVRDAAVLNEALAPDLLIVDEAQRIRNWRTKTADAIKAIATRYAFVLTGTPLENRLEDLYSVMQLVDARVLGPLWRYLLDFHVTDDRGRVLGYRNLSELRRRLEPVMLRRDRRLVRDQLPDRVELRLDLPLSPRQRDLHDEAVSAAKHIARILRRRPLTPSEERRLLSLLQQARMACDAAGLVDKESRGAPKLDELASLLETFCLEHGRKVVVFSEWERMTAMAAEVARGLGLGVVRLHGGVPTSRRGELLSRFASDPTAQVFVSTDAGGVGLNLQAASVLINLDVPWNPAVLAQRVARVHRLGQAEAVQIVYMTSLDSYEQRVAELAAGKRELFVHVVTDDATDDVVGLSRRSVEALAEALEPDDDNDYRGDGTDATDAEAGEAGPSETAARVAEMGESGPGEAGPGEADSEESGAADDGSIEVPSSGDAEADDTAHRRALAQLQAALGARIERVLVAEGGLIAVVDRVDEVAEAASRSASDGVVVVVIDRQAFLALERLGPSSPWAGARPLSGGATRAGDARSPRPRLLLLAERQLRSAEVLVASGCAADGLGLAAGAMIAALAHRAALAEPPARERAAVWLYTEALPRGLATGEEVAAVTSALALSQSAEVPAAVAGEVLAALRRQMEASGGR